MSKNNQLICETCGLDTHQIDTPIFEKPLKFAFRSNIRQLKQKTDDQRTQENICLDCFSKELKQLSEGWKTKYSVSFK